MKGTKIIVIFATVAVTLSLLLAACLSGQDGEDSGEFATVTIRLGSADNSRQLVDIETNGTTKEKHSYTLSIDGGAPITLELSADNTLSFSIQIGSHDFEARAYGKADEIWNQPNDPHPFLTGSTVLRAVGKTSRVVTEAGPNTFQIVLYSATEVNAWEQLAWAVGGSSGSDRKEIIILKPNSVAGAWDADKAVIINRPIELRAEGAVTINRSSGTATPPAPYTGAFFEVTAGELIIGGDGSFIMDGGSANNPPLTADYPLIMTGADCIIGKDVTLQNNKNASTGGYCGGVAINSGTFRLYGKITGNESSEGGGVYVASGGTFIMDDGGIITQNKSSSNGGGVHIASGGTFIMDEGIISQNESSNGAGVYVEGTFNMSGGSITYNKAGSGGGVYMNTSTGTLKISGGTVSHNIADAANNGDGGGVYINNGTVELTSGAISNNKTLNGNGGGVYVGNGTTFNMSGGDIANNEAANNGGGVYLSGSGKFNINSPAASGTSGNVKDNTVEAPVADNPNVYFDNSGTSLIGGDGLDPEDDNGW